MNKLSKYIGFITVIITIAIVIMGFKIASSQNQTALQIEGYSSKNKSGYVEFEAIQF